MPIIGRSVATLRIFGDDLNPAEISKALGCDPTPGRGTGFKIEGSRRESKVVRTGAWQLCATDREPANIDDQVAELLSQISGDLDVWRTLSSKYDVDLFCGLFGNSLSQQDLVISAPSLLALGERGIDVSFDIYLSEKTEE